MEANPYVRIYMNQSWLEFEQSSWDAAGLHLGSALKMAAGQAGVAERAFLQDDGTIFKPQGSLILSQKEEKIVSKVKDSSSSIKAALADPLTVLADETTESNGGMADAVTPKYVATMVGAFLSELVYLNRLDGLSQCAVGAPETL